MTRLLHRLKTSLFCCMLPLLAGSAYADQNGEVYTSNNAPYPSLTAFQLKGLQPDLWPNQAEITGNNTKRVVVNLAWWEWEPEQLLVASNQSCPAGYEKYDGHCFKINTLRDNDLRGYSDRGVAVTALVYGAPAGWAISPSCKAPADKRNFCAPVNPDDFARFAGMVARRYNGLNGHGRAVDFVIHNEVNTQGWFDTACSPDCSGVAANLWVQTYASNYNKAYDIIKREQGAAKVLVPLTHDFSKSLDNFYAGQGSIVLSTQTFMEKFVPLIGGREFRLAYHSYPKDLFSPTFGADDLPYVTFGNIGVLAGWLRKTYPDKPYAWEIQLTENGVNSSPTQEAQAKGVCDSFVNVLGTPGIESYIYHRLRDQGDEGGLATGLRDAAGNPRQAWAKWALANRNDLTPPQLSCGFENLPYVKLTRSLVTARGHWASTRIPPSNSTAEASWKILRDAAPNTRMIYECQVGATGQSHNLLSPDVNCEGLQTLGPVGYFYTTPNAAPGLIPMYRCRVGLGTDHFISPAANCEGTVTESLLGYVKSM